MESLFRDLSALMNRYKEFVMQIRLNSCFGINVQSTRKLVCIHI